MTFSSDIPAISNQAPQTINLPDLDKPELFQERLEQLLRYMNDAINAKEGGLYTLNETITSEQYYIQSNPQKFRNVYRKTFDFVFLNGANIGAGAAVNFPHNITSLLESAFIYANCTATDGRRFSVVFPDVWADSTDAFFVNPIAVTLSQCDVILNVLKEL